MKRHRPTIEYAARCAPRRGTRHELRAILADDARIIMRVTVPRPVREEWVADVELEIDEAARAEADALSSTVRVALALVEIQGTQETELRRGPAVLVRPQEIAQVAGFGPMTERDLSPQRLVPMLMRHTEVLLRLHAQTAMQREEAATRALERAMTELERMRQERALEADARERLASESHQRVLELAALEQRHRLQDRVAEAIAPMAPALVGRITGAPAAGAEAGVTAFISGLTDEQLRSLGQWAVEHVRDPARLATLEALVRQARRPKNGASS